MDIEISLQASTDAGTRNLNGKNMYVDVQVRGLSRDIRLPAIGEHTLPKLRGRHGSEPQMIFGVDSLTSRQAKA